MAPHVFDDHLFRIESRLLAICEKLEHRDEILRKLNYKLAYLSMDDHNNNEAVAQQQLTIPPADS